MPKHKSRPTKKKSKTKAVQRKRQRESSPIKFNSGRENYTEEYQEYLERYEIMGEGRPRLSPAEFDRFDTEFLDLLTIQGEMGLLSDDQMVRLQELEYLLLDEP